MYELLRIMRADNHNEIKMPILDSENEVPFLCLIKIVFIQQSYQQRSIYITI